MGGDEKGAEINRDREVIYISIIKQENNRRMDDLHKNAGHTHTRNRL